MDVEGGFGGVFERHPQNIATKLTKNGMYIRLIQVCFRPSYSQTANAGITRRPAPLLNLTAAVLAVGCMPLLGASLFRKAASKIS